MTNNIETIIALTFRASPWHPSASEMPLLDNHRPHRVRRAYFPQAPRYQAADMVDMIGEWDRFQHHDCFPLSFVSTMLAVS